MPEHTTSHPYQGKAMAAPHRAAILHRADHPGATVTIPAFQAPGQSGPQHPRPRPRRDRGPSPYVGDCPVCGGTDLAMVGRSLAEHNQRRMRSGKNGAPEEYDSGERCPGSLGAAEPGTRRLADPSHNQDPT